MSSFYNKSKKEQFIWVLTGLFIIVLLVSGIDYGITQIKLSQIPEYLRINTDKDNILGAQVIPQGKIYDKKDPTKVIYEGEVVKYAYKTKKIEDKLNEVVEKRTSHSRTIKIAEDKVKNIETYQLEVISGEPQYYEDEEGEWYQADYGTTDINTYALETKGNVIAQLFFPEKVYATTGTFYPDAHVETSTFDGYVSYYKNVNFTSTFSDGYAGQGWIVAPDWANVRAKGSGVSLSASDNAGNIYVTSYLNISIDDPYSTSSWKYTSAYVQRGELLFDTSALTSGAILSSAIIYLTPGGTQNQQYHFVSLTTSSNTAANTNDSFGSTSFGYITPTTYQQTENVTLNSSGLSNISLTSISKFGLMVYSDFYNSAPSALLYSGWTYIPSEDAYGYTPNADGSTGGGNYAGDSAWFYDAEYSGTSYDPKLVITYTAPPSAPTLSSPADVTTNQATTITFGWDASSGATSYKLQVSTSDSFASYFHDADVGNNTSHEVVGLTAGTTYYWRVYAVNGAGDSPASSTRSFTTLAPPANIKQDVIWFE